MDAPADAASSRRNDLVLPDLEAILGDRLATSLAVREQHGHDES